MVNLFINNILVVQIKGREKGYINFNLISKHKGCPTRTGISPKILAHFCLFVGLCEFDISNDLIASFIEFCAGAGSFCATPRLLHYKF